MMCELSKKNVILNVIHEARQSDDSYFFKIKFLIDI